MRCSKAHIKISAALDGELDQVERAALARHLEDCSECVAYQTDLERCRVLLRESECAPSAEFEWKVQLAISKALRERAAHEMAPRAGRFWLPAGLSAVATAAVVLAVGLWWLAGQTPQGSGFAAGSNAQLASNQARSAPLRELEQSSTFRPRVVSTMPEWGRRARPDWRTPPSLQGQISTVNGLHMLTKDTLDSHLHFEYRNSDVRDGAADSLSLSPTSPKAR